MASEARPLESATLDHVMVMVHGLQAASDDFRRFGFRVIPGGQLPGGLENTIIPFGIGKPYVELVGVRTPGGAMIRDNEEFLAKGEGAIYAGLRVTSADAVAKRLRDLGIQVPDPFTGTITVEGVTNTPPALWKDVIIPHGSSPRSDPLFFVESLGDYRAILGAQDPELLRQFDEQRSLPHPNSSTALVSVWLAVGQLDDAVRQYESLGATRVRDFPVEHLQARAVELALGRGSLIVLGDATSSGPIRRMLDLRGFGIEVPGITIQVENLDRALTSLDAQSGPSVERVAGAVGRHAIIPPTSAHGLWIELREQFPSKN